MQKRKQRTEEKKINMRYARNNGSVQQQAFPLEQAVDIRPNPAINKGDCRFQHWFWREGTITVCL